MTPAVRVALATLSMLSASATVAGAAVAQALATTTRDSASVTASACASCRFRESADAYRRAEARVAGAWRTYFGAMAVYEGCIASSLRADAGRCADPPRAPAESPCAAPVGKGVALCNATLPPDRPGAEFIALPDSLASIDLRQSAFTSAGAVRYVWDALTARRTLRAAAPAADRGAAQRRRQAADSLLAAIAASARPTPEEVPAFHAALDAGIARLNRAAVSDDPDEYVDALEFVALADSLHPSPEAKFVMGLITYQIGEHALLAAWQIHNCGVVLLAADAIMKSDRYLSENGGVAPENAIRLRASLELMRQDATQLVTRRCL
jgi:hypothetical protein